MSNARELAELGGAYSTGGYPHFKNRIINGAMMIDQRNAGASVSSSNAFVLDRWNQVWVGAGALTGQQVADAPAGFTYSYKSTVATADASLAASDNYQPFYQPIEGFNIADLAWGTASAATVTLSFWVKASVAGTYSVAVRNGSSVTRSYVSTFSVSSANTWEQKSITIAGDTSGTWGATNSVGLYLNIGAIQGSDKQAPSLNTWNAGNYISSTTQTNWIATLSATLQITGVQLEKGSTATSFDYRPYGTELALCQRYYWKTTTGTYSAFGAGVAQSSTAANCYIQYPVMMRAIPTLGYSGSISCHGGGVAPNLTAIANSYAGMNSARIDVTCGGGGLTNGQGAMLYVGATSASDYFYASAEL